jgi:hypothetical protein
MRDDEGCLPSIHHHMNVDRSATHVAILYVGLFFHRTVQDEFNRLAAVRADGPFGLEHDYVTQALAVRF